MGPRSFKTRNLLCIPVVHADVIIGVLLCLNKNGGRDFGDQDQTIGGVLAKQIAETYMKHGLSERKVRACVHPSVSHAPL